MHDNLTIYARKKGEHIFNRQYMVRTESTERRWKGKAIVASHNDDGDRIPSEYNAEDSRGSPLNDVRSEEQTSELQSLMRISYAVFCLKKQNKRQRTQTDTKNK